VTEKPLTKNITPGAEPLDLKAYERAGGYQAIRKALKDLTPGQVIDMVVRSNLRGRGGAGFPTGPKWRFMPRGTQARRPQYLAVNADEMEPGTFKDRLLMEGDPHQLLEGIMVSSYALEVDVAYLFLRRAYEPATTRLRRAIAAARAAGYIGRNIFGSSYSLDIHLHTSAGRYMCGEETAMLNALEGRRGTPRAKPPYPAVAGLWGHPTTVDNVETISCVPHIVNHGPEWFLSLSRTRDGGTKIYGASGKVRRPGLWELPMGTPAREILEEHAGGMREGLRCRAVIPGGASTPFLMEKDLDLPMDFDGLAPAGSRLGTGTMIVLDDRTCPVGMMHSLELFFARESCGWCTPCRDGLPWTEKTLRAIEEGRGEMSDLKVLEDHTVFLGPGRTFCYLAPGAMEPIRSGLAHFREDIERHIRDKRCPWRQ
jgi:NADH-quinone oxidoreductase subunit F